MTIDDLIARARGGDAKAMAALLSTARYLGLGLGSVVNAIDPSHVYISGEITAAWDLIEPTVRAALAERALDAAGRRDADHGGAVGTTSAAARRRGAGRRAVIRQRSGRLKTRLAAQGSRPMAAVLAIAVVCERGHGAKHSDQRVEGRRRRLLRSRGHLALPADSGDGPLPNACMAR